MLFRIFCISISENFVKFRCFFKKRKMFRNSHFSWERTTGVLLSELFHQDYSVPLHIHQCQIHISRTHRFQFLPKLSHAHELSPSFSEKNRPVHISRIYVLNYCSDRLSHEDLVLLHLSLTSFLVIQSHNQSTDFFTESKFIKKKKKTSYSFILTSPISLSVSSRACIICSLTWSRCPNAFSLSVSFTRMACPTVFNNNWPNLHCL